MDSFERKADKRFSGGFPLCFSGGEGGGDGDLSKCLDQTFRSSGAFGCNGLSTVSLQSSQLRYSMGSEHPLAYVQDPTENPLIYFYYVRSVWPD